MVAYSFRPRFVEPIRAGLEEVYAPMSFNGVPHPKRQTIRADRRRHARPGEELQLYCGMRTKGCFLIGCAKCVSVAGIRIQLGREIISVDDYPAVRDGDLDPFAQSDGFLNWEDMRAFWKAEHHGRDFEGVIIKWEPLP